jgi:hypothetical protein
LGAPTLNRQGDSTIVEPDSWVGALTKPAPGAQFRGLAILQAAEKKWSGREDLNLRPPGPEKGIRMSLRMFSISYSGASTVSVLLDHLILG